MDIPPIDNGTAWPERRQQLLNLFSEHLYGHTPCDIPLLQIIDDDHGRLVDDVLCRQITLGLPTINKYIYLIVWSPKDHNNNLPTFIGLNFHGNHCLQSDPNILFAPSSSPDEPPGWMACRWDEDKRGAQERRWPIKEICAAGFAVASVYCADFAPDHKTLFDSGFAGAYAPGHAEDWRCISRWAWGLSCIRKFLSTQSSFDAERMIAIGHSRLGKTSLWAGAQDENFAMSCVNNSGCNGAAYARRCQGERYRDIGTHFPHWFLPSFSQYFDRESEFPIDQHQLIACLAPRPCYVASGSEDHGADPEGEFTSLRLSAPAWTMCGKTPIPIDSSFPEINTHLHADNAYHLRAGPHDIVGWDWQLYIQYAQAHFTKQQ